MKKKKNTKKIFKEQSFIPIALMIIVILIVYYFFVFLKEKKIKELEELKKTIESKKQLNDALKKTLNKTFTSIRIFFILLYFLINAYLYYFFNNSYPTLVSLGHLVNINTTLFIFVSAITFAKFGSFNSYHKWWSFLETRIEVIIYKNNPDIREIIKNDTIYKKQLESEIEKLNY